MQDVDIKGRLWSVINVLKYHAVATGRSIERENGAHACAVARHVTLHGVANSLPVGVMSRL